MSTVYIVEGDPDFIASRFQDFDESVTLIEFFRSGTPIPAGFNPEIEYYFCGDVSKGIVSDIPEALPHDGMILSARAAEVLGPLLKLSGQLYGTRPATLRSLVLPMDYRIFVCHRELDALDSERTEYLPEEKRLVLDGISRYSFKAGITDKAGIFRVKGARSRLFVTNEFVDLVERHRLSGLRVKPIWSEDEGSLATFVHSVTSFERIPPGCGGTVAGKRAAIRDWMAGRRERQPGWR